MTIVSNLDLIRRVPLFSDLTTTQTSVLYANIGKKRFKRGENIVEEGRISGTLVHDPVRPGARPAAGSPWARGHHGHAGGG